MSTSSNLDIAANQMKPGIDSNDVGAEGANVAGLSPPYLALEQEADPTNGSSVIKVQSRIDLEYPFQFYCTICIASYIGALIRVGISYFRIWKIETSYTVMFANILGSFIIGFMRHCKSRAISKSGIDKIIFIGITTGLCGSITSFSTWAMESNKSLFLQFDTSWGNSASSYNGGRFLEWLVSLWSGVAVPLSALQLGVFASNYFPIDSYFNKEDITNQPPKKTLEYCIYAFVIIASFILIAVPIFNLLAHNDYIMSSSYLFYTALFGFIGTSCRYHLSLLNSNSPSFPIGTFLANVSGTCLLAIITVLSKFVVDYYNIDAQSILFGLSFGFCGCLTTVSTFVNEINDMSQLDAYKYSIGTNIAAQLGIFFIYNIYSYTTVKIDVLMPKPIDQCFVYQKYCGILMSRVGCPSSFIKNTACTNMHDYSTFIGECSCGSFEGDRVGELMVDSQVKFNSTNSFVAVWPSNAKMTKSPTEVIDYCLTYKSMCDHYLNRIGCPANKRYTNACGRNGLTHAQDICICADAIDVPSHRISELIVDTLLLRRYDLVPYNGYVTRNTTNFCTGWRHICHSLLEHLQCPMEDRSVTGCSDDSDYMTYPAAGATCECGQFSKGGRVAENLYDAIVRPNFQHLVKRVSNDQNIWDVCTSYKDVCSLFLDKIGCPQNYRVIYTCGGSTQGYPNGVVQEFNGTCHCGNLQELTLRSINTIIDSLLFEDMNNDILYIAPPQAPFSLLVASNPYKQLT